MYISRSQVISQATEHMVLTCANTGELYTLWDKTRGSKQSDEFIAIVLKLIKKYEPIILPHADEVIQQTLEYWSDN